MKLVQILPECFLESPEHDSVRLFCGSSVSKSPDPVLSVDTAVFPFSFQSSAAEQGVKDKLYTTKCKFYIHICTPIYAET